MNFYKSVIEYKGKLLVRAIENGKEYKERVNFEPTLYSLSNQGTEWKTLQGQSLKPMTFTSIDAARKFRSIAGTSNSAVYGLERYHYQYINENYPGAIQWSKDKIKIFTLDIECTCENGFPDVENPTESLLCITVKNQSNKQILTWGVGEYKQNGTTYIK